MPNINHSFQQYFYANSNVFTARILVATGMPRQNGQNTEIIDLINPKLEFEPIDNIPARSGSVGGLGNVSHKMLNNMNNF